MNQLNNLNLRKNILYHTLKLIYLNTMISTLLKLLTIFNLYNLIRNIKILCEGNSLRPLILITIIILFDSNIRNAVIQIKNVITDLIVINAQLFFLMCFIGLLCYFIANFEDLNFEELNDKNK